MTEKADAIYAFGPYVLDRTQWRLSHDDRVVPLPPKALALLLLLVENHGRLVTKTEVLAKLWEGTFVEEANVAFYVAMIRKALSQPAGTTYIETIKTRGYRFVAPVGAPRPAADTSEALAGPEPSAAPAMPPPPVAARAWGRRAATGFALLLAIVAALGVARDLRGADRARPAHRETASGDAYDLFLQGRERWRIRTPESVRQAIGLYEQAIAIDPQFSRAYAGLADCYNLAMSGLPAAYRYPRAKENAQKAIALDPDSADAHTSLAFMRYKFEWRWQESDQEFRRAIALNPRYGLAHHWYGEFLGLMDRPDEAIAELKIALELDPSSLAVRADMLRPLIRARRFAEARRVLDEGLQIDRNWYAMPLMMADILAIEGHDRESAEQTWRALTLRGAPAAEIDELRAAFDTGGMRGMIRAQIRQLLRQDGAQRSSASFFTAQTLSFFYGRLGDRDEALRWIQTSIDRREDVPIHMLTNWSYDKLRDDPRFVQILERLNLTRPLAH